MATLEDENLQRKFVMFRATGFEGPIFLVRLGRDPLKIITMWNGNQNIA